jgi:hypothetical protein
MKSLPPDFVERAFRHIVYLAGLGTRVAGTENEAQAIAYVRQRLEELGIPVVVEPFDFETFEILDVDFEIGGKTYTPTLVGFNPYGGVSTFTGRATLLDPQAPAEVYEQLDIQDAVIVTAAPVDYFRLVFQQPRLIVFVHTADYADIRAQTDDHFTLRVQGKRVTRQSANVIGQLVPRAGADAEIIVSAHLDAYGNSPGALDNGSGVGVLIELARYFKTLEDEITCRLNFIAFGAEELGILGSRVYVESHPDDLKRCALAFNLDQVGGGSRPDIEMLGGVKGMPAEKGQSQFPVQIKNRALDGQQNNWKIIANPDLVAVWMASNHPGWLLEIIQESVTALGIEIEPAGNMGSDQQAFSQAGVVATGIGTGGNRRHSPEDTPDQIHTHSLEKVGRIVVAVVMKTMQRLAGGKDANSALR